MTEFRNQQLRALVPDGYTSTADYVLDEIQFGTNGGAGPVVHITNPTSVTGLTYSYEGPVPNPGTTGELMKLHILGTLDAGSGNGKTFREIGLVFHDGTLAARVVISPLYKSVEIELDVEWVLSCGFSVP
jgi:hypothetical protein